MSYGAAIDVLVDGPGRNLVSVTIPEGRSRREIQRLIAPDGLSGSYLAATLHSPSLDPGRYGGSRARDLEGFLFPSTEDVLAKGRTQADGRRDVGHRLHPGEDRHEIGQEGRRDGRICSHA